MPLLPHWDFVACSRVTLPFTLPSMQCENSRLTSNDNRSLQRCGCFSLLVCDAVHWVNKNYFLLFIYLFILFSRLFDVSTYSCAHLTIILSFSSICLCHRLLLLIPFSFIIIIIIIIIILIINCNWVVTRWQWLFYMYTKHEIGYY